MKKILCLLICLIILISISVVAYAFNADTIQPDTNTIIVGVTGQDVPVYGTLPPVHNGSYLVIISPPNVIPTVPVEKETTQNENTTTNTDTEESTIPEPMAVIENELAEAIYLATNEERTRNDLNTLAYNFKLQDAADIRAKEASEQFSHTRPDNTDCYTVFPEDYNVAGENLIMSDKQIAIASVLMKTWMESQGHRNNILNVDYTSIAIGVYEKDNVVYVS